LLQQKKAFLTSYARHITILIRGADFSCAQSVADVVRAHEKITLLTNAENPNITAEAYDLTHFSDLREQYQVMSVPCLLINDRIRSFGKKNIRELLGLLA
jgi:thioredoxin reductase